MGYIELADDTPEDAVELFNKLYESSQILPIND